MLGPTLNWESSGAPWAQVEPGCVCCFLLSFFTGEIFQSNYQLPEKNNKIDPNL